MIAVYEDTALEVLYYLRNHLRVSVVLLLADREVGPLGGGVLMPLESIIHQAEKILEGQRAFLEKCYASS